jgi:hypothetical protein
MIAVTLSKPDSATPLLRWLKDQKICGECNRTLTFSRRPHAVKLADGSFAIYALCRVCHRSYRSYYELDLYVGEGPKFAPRHYALPNISADSHRLTAVAV